MHDLISVINKNYLIGVFGIILMLLKPQRIHHSGIQSSHQCHRNDTSDKEPSGTVGLGEPFIGPIFHAEIHFFIEVDCQKQWNVENCCWSPWRRNNDLKYKLEMMLVIKQSVSQDGRTEKQAGKKWKPEMGLNSIASLIISCLVTWFLTDGSSKKIARLEA